MGQAPPVIRPMAPAEEIDVRHLYEVLYPRWPRKPNHWYQAHPTLVLFSGATIIGSTSYSVGMPPMQGITTAEVMYGHGLYVHPGFQGRGFGRQLADARFAVGAELGLQFIGMTQPGNAAMKAIFESQGLTAWGEVAEAYPDGSTGLIYMGRP